MFRPTFGKYAHVYKSKQTAVPFVVYWDMPNPDAGAPGVISRPGHGGRLGAWGTYQSHTKISSGKQKPATP